MAAELFRYRLFLSRRFRAMPGLFAVALCVAVWVALLSEGVEPATAQESIQGAPLALATTATPVTTTTPEFPSEGPLRYPLRIFALLAILGAAFVGIVAILGVVAYLVVRRTRKGPPPA